MELEFSYDSADDIPDGYAELFSEKGGKFLFSGVKGLPTREDMNRLETSLAKEREATKAVKDKLAVWGDLDHEDVVAKLDRIPELEAAADGKLDDDKINALAERRVEGVLKSKMAPLERKLAKAEQERAEAAERADGLHKRITTRDIHEDMRAAAEKAGVRPEAIEEVLLYADRLFERTEEGQTVTRDQVGVTPGLDPRGWLDEVLPSKPHWPKPSVGGGASGSKGGPGGPSDNPWRAENWNKTKQAQFERQHGPEKAKKAAEAAGSSLDAVEPPKKTG